MVMSTGSLPPSWQHGQRDLLAGSPWIMIDGLVDAHALGRLAVDLDDQVAGQDAGLVGRRADHRADDRQLAAVLRSMPTWMPMPPNLPSLCLLELLVLARG